MKNKALVTVAAVLLLGCARQVPYANQQSEILQFVEGSFPYKIELCESSEEAYDAIAFKIKNYPTKDCNLLAEDLMNSIELENNLFNEVAQVELNFVDNNEETVERFIFAMK